MRLDPFITTCSKISPSARIGNNVKIGNNTVIYDNVIVGDNTVICNDCVIGEPTSLYYHDTDNYENAPTVIGSNSLIRSHSIIYAGCTFGTKFQCGHRVTIRENTITGTHCSIGTLCDIQGDVEFGNYVRLHSNVHIGKASIIGNFCWIYPYTVFTNDPTPPSDMCVGPVIGDYSIISTHCLLLPGVRIGEHCLVGAYTMVTKDIPNYQVVLGAPGRVIKDIREVRDRVSGESHYPWPHRFSKHMPWEGIGYDNWIKH